MPTRRFARGPQLHPELRAAHATALARLRSVDAEIEELLVRRRTCTSELAALRPRINLRYSTRHRRRDAWVDEPPVPPAPVEADPLHGVELRAVCLRLLRRHGPQRLRDLHGLLHCYGFTVDSARPVQRLGDAMGYECRQGRVRRVQRGVYEAARDVEAPYPPWLGAPPPSDRDPLPWAEPLTDPGPPLLDPEIAHDPVLWSGGGHLDPPDDTPPPHDHAGPPAAPTAPPWPAPPSDPPPPDPPSDPPRPAPPSPASLGGDSSANRRPGPQAEIPPSGPAGPAAPPTSPAPPAPVGEEGRDDPDGSP